MDDLKKGIKITIVLTIICGLLYPLLITGIGQLIFPSQANGSVIEHNGVEVGSKLIGQQYNDDSHFIGRISAVNYNISEDGTEIDATSGSQNLGVTSSVLKERVDKDIKTFLEKNPSLSKEDISSELISQSGSGLDPDITPQGAKIQIDRVSKVTGISEGDLNKLIDKNTKGKWLGLYGSERVNVLELNLAVDDMKK